MADVQPEEAGRRGSRRSRASTNDGTRLAALQRLRRDRSGDRRRAEVKMEDPIYDTVEEDEYDKLVAKRKEDFKGFIVDDNGLGYGDEGEEEDWSQAGGPVSSDESGGENERPKKKKGAEKKVPATKKPVDTASLVGKLNLSSMFNTSVFKKNKDNKAKNSSSGSLVDDLIAEHAPNEADLEKRQRNRLNLLPAVRSQNYSIAMPPPPPPSVELMRHSDIDRKPSISSKQFVNSEEKSEMGNEGNLPMEAENGLDLDSSEVVTESLTNGSLADAVPDDDKIEGNGIELKPEGTRVAEEGGFVLNATINEIKDPAACATAGWQAVVNAGNGSTVCDVAETVPSMNGKLNFNLQPDGSLPFYILDAYEEYYGANMGNLYLFGKVKVESTYSSCCVVVKNMQRCVYAIPRSSVFPEDVIMKLENDVKEARISRSSFIRELQEMASGLKTEIRKELMDRNVSTFSMKPVKRNYAFEQSEQSNIPLGQYTVLKVNYPFKDPPLPSDLKGESFSALLGTHSSALEHFLVKRKIKGPSWLSVSKFSTRPAAQLVSWCKYEIIVECPKDVKVSTSSDKPPPVVATAINLKTILSEKHNGSEIVSASIICCPNAKIDQPTLDSEWTKPGMLRHFTVTRKLEGGIFPMGFSNEVKARNSKTGANVISTESSERALINRLMVELHKWDSDILVGHNISGFDLDVLLHRAQACKVSSNMWSKIGRLKRSVMPKLTKGNTIFGSGASPGIMSCIAGRLLCDTYLSSRDLLKEVSYSLTQLAKSQLKKDRKEIAPHNIHSMFQRSESLMELIECSQTDAWLSMGLMFRLNVLPLTRQLTILSGNLWGKTLQGARAQRVEYLLLHAFHAKKYMVPDKLSPRSKETKLTKRKVNQGAVDGDNDDAIDNPENDVPDRENSKAKKGPSYSGGLVLEPKRGFYDKYILLLDFNSLYPSIIQEYNICFTTVERSAEGVYHLPSNDKIPGVLPQLLKNLVERRKSVKRELLKPASSVVADQLQIQQQALKLTANSMYGCLGFSNSRFYAKPLAEMITLQGREILQNTVDLVQNKLNLEVIYGDTDSVMIYSGLDDAEKAEKISTSVIKEVNRKYKCLEIDLDGLYKRMLLLKKKKYAAVKVVKKDGTLYEVIERKGLDMVRRDWSLLSKQLGDFCLDQILSGGSRENVVESIHSALMKVQEDMRNGQVELDKYVITKSLTKPPEAYPDGKNQPHVEVALRLKRNGYTAGCSAGDTVPYIICCEKGTGSSSSVGIAQRARHPDELKRENEKWMIDIDYYLSQQIHPVVSRLCASIEGTSPARLADCLGLDSSKFQSKSSEGATDASNSLLFAVNDDERYQSCEPLVLSCPSCSGCFDCPTVLSSALASISEEKTDDQLAGESSKTFWSKLHCPKCPKDGDTGRISPILIANQVKRQAEGFISRYYKGLMTCDEETCNYNTRGVNLRVVGDSERGTVCPNYPRCTGHLTRKYTEADLYKQLSYFCNVLDTVRCIEKVEHDMKIPVGKELGRIRPVVDLAASTAQKMRDRCAFGWVQLKDLIVLV